MAVSCYLWLSPGNWPNNHRPFSPTSLAGHDLCSFTLMMFFIVLGKLNLALKVKAFFI